MRSILPITVGAFGSTRRRRGSLLFISHASKYLENPRLYRQNHADCLGGRQYGGLPAHRPRKISTNGRNDALPPLFARVAGGLSPVLVGLGCRLRAMDRVHHAAGLKMQESVFFHAPHRGAQLFVSPRSLPARQIRDGGVVPPFQTLCGHENIHGTRIDAPLRRSSGGSMAF